MEFALWRWAGCWVQFLQRAVVATGSEKRRGKEGMDSVLGFLR